MPLKVIYGYDRIDSDVIVVLGLHTKIKHLKGNIIPFDNIAFERFPEIHIKKLMEVVIEKGWKSITFVFPENDGNGTTC